MTTGVGGVRDYLWQSGRLRLLAWVLFWMLLGTLSLYSLVGRVLVFSLPYAKDDILERIAVSIGNQVYAQSLESGWHGMSPWVRLQGFRIVTQQGIAAVQADLAEFDINPWQSLLTGRVVPDVVRILGMDLQIVQDEAGLIGLKGGQGGIELDLQPLVDFALDAKTFSLAGARLRLESELPHLKGRPLDLRLGADKTYQGVFSNLQAQLETFSQDSPDVSQGKMVLTGRFQGDTRDLDRMTGDFSIRMDNLDMTHWRTPLSVAGGVLELASGTVTGALHLQPGQNILARLELGRVQGRFFNTQGNAAALAADSIKVSLKGTIKDDWQIQVALQSASAASLPLQTLALAVASKAQTEGARSYWLRLDQIDTEPLRNSALVSETLQGNPRRWLLKIRPHAILKNLYARIDTTPDEPVRLALSAGLREVEAQAFNAIPFVDGLSAKLLVFEGGGLLEVNPDPFTVAFPNLFEPDIEIDTASVEISFVFGDESFFVASNAMTAYLDQGSVTGSFAVSNPKDPKFRTLSLELGVLNADAKRGLAFIPKQLPEEVKVWLRSAILAGGIPRVGAIYHGHLDVDQPFDLSSIGLVGDIIGGELRYDPAWPELKKINGRLHITESESRTYFSSSKLFEMPLSDIDLYAPSTPSAENPIRINGRTVGRLAQMFQFMRDTPAREFIDDEVLSWQLKGEGDFNVNVTIPLAVGIDLTTSSTADNEVDVILSGSVTNAHLVIPTLDMVFTEGFGDLTIDSDIGVYSKKLVFQIFGNRSEGWIYSNWDDPENEKIYLGLKGIVENSPFADWLELPPMHLFNGRFQYQGDVEVTLTPEVPIRMWLSSDLADLDVTMPVPFRKVLNERRKLSVDLETVGEDLVHLKFDLEPDIRGWLELDDGTLTRGILHLADDEPLVLPAERTGLEVKGFVSQTADAGDWFDYTDAIDESYLKYPGDTEVAPNIVRLVAVEGALLYIGDFGLTDFDLEMTRGADIWQSVINSKEVAGTFDVYDDDSLPATARLKRVSLVTDAVKANLPNSEQQASSDSGDQKSADAAEDAPPPADFLADLEFKDILATDVEIQNFSLNGENHGVWSFKVRPTSDSVSILELSGSISGLTLQANTDGVSALHWSRTEAGNQTTYEGSIIAEDLGAVLESWGNPEIVHTKSARIDANISWPAAPTMFEWNDLKGSVGVNLREGSLHGSGSGLTAAAKLMSLLDVSFWFRLLRLNFSNLSSGIAFDKIEGNFNLESGLIRTNEPVRMSGSGAALAFNGEVNLLNEQISGELITTLPISKNLPWTATAYAVVIANPLIGIGGWIAERIFRKRINRLASLKHQISGSLSDVEIKLDRMFGGNFSVTKSDIKADENTPLKDPKVVPGG